MMRRHGFYLPLLCALLLLAAGAASGLDGAAVLRLKRAGVSDETLERLVREKSLETGALTVEEILALKAAGIGEETLQSVIEAGSFLRDRSPVVYGRGLRPIRLSTVEDLLQLKQAGFSDEVLQAVIAAGRSGDEREREEALRLLEGMGIWLDPRR
ncbi:MAG: hypothetical protein WHT06_05730 [Desulfobacterales bacterium]